MITLHKHPENIQICKLKSKKKTTPVYWHPVRNPQLRMAVQDINSFATEEMRDRFRISKNQIHVKAQAGSAMPAGLTAALNREQLRDLICFLTGQGRK